MYLTVVVVKVKEKSEIKLMIIFNIKKYIASFLTVKFFAVNNIEDNMETHKVP